MLMLQAMLHSEAGCSCEPQLATRRVAASECCSCCSELQHFRLLQAVAVNCSELQLAMRREVYHTCCCAVLASSGGSRGGRAGVETGDETGDAVLMSPGGRAGARDCNGPYQAAKELQQGWVSCSSAATGLAKLQPG